MMKCIISADDTNVLYTGDDVSEIKETISTEFDKLSTWFNANKLFKFLINKFYGNK